MSGIAGFVGMSHSPFVTISPPSSDHSPGASFMAEAAKVRAAVAELAPAAIILIGPDHFHANFYDSMPPFLLGVEGVKGFGDFGSPTGYLPVASELAWSVQDGLSAADFDIAVSYALNADHGITQTYSMLAGDTAVPMVPIVVNTAGPPLPSLNRCVALGRALGKVVRESRSHGDVLIAASGGLSHWLPSNDPRSQTVSKEKRASVIHGRSDLEAVAKLREPLVRAMGGDSSARVNAEWDRWFLQQLVLGDIAPITSLGHDGLENEAGSGGHEIRCWLVGYAAMDRPLVWTSYEPVPEWVTGMGIGTTFAVSP